MKNILVIAGAFAPKNSIGAVRLSKLVKYLVRFGYSVVVLYPEIDMKSTNVRAEEREFEQIRRFQIPHSQFFVSLFLNRRNKLLQTSSTTNLITSLKHDSLLKKTKKILFRFIQFIYSLISGVDWSINAKKFIKNNFAENEFDVIFTSYPGIGVHWAGIYARKKNYGKQLITDFRDPINYTSSRFSFYYILNTYLQYRVVKKADIVTHISADMKDKFPSQYQQKYELLVNGFDKEDIPIVNSISSFIENKDKRRTLDLCYVGSLYGGKRKLHILFRVLNELIVDKIIDKDEVRFFYAGKEFGVLLEQAKEFRMSGILINRGLITREESLVLQATCDLIIVSTWNTIHDKGIITGKIFEAFLLKKNILGIVNGNLPGSEFKRIVDDVNGGFVIEEGTNDLEKEFEKMKNYMTQMYKEKIIKGIIKSSYNDKTDDYSYENITKRLLTLFF